MINLIKTIEIVREEVVRQAVCDICKSEYDEGRSTLSAMTLFDESEENHSYAHFDICPRCFAEQVVPLLVNQLGVQVYGDKDDQQSFNEKNLKDWGFQDKGAVLDNVLKSNKEL